MPTSVNKRVAAGIGQGGAHALGTGHLGDGADRPIRGNPFARGMGEHGGQIDDAGGLVDRGGLDRGDLMLTERLAHDVEAARQRGIAEGALPLPCPSGADRGGQRFFRIDQFGLRLGQGGGQGRDRFTGPVHGWPPSTESKLTAPDFERLARTPCPIASLASSGISV